MQDVHKAVVGEPIPISYYEAISVVFVHTHLLHVPGLNQGTAWLRSPSVVFTLSQLCRVVILLGVAELGYYRLRVRLPKNNTSKNIKLMQCPECQSIYVNKNGQKKGKQNYICVNCARQFIDCYQPQKGYSWEGKRECLCMLMVWVFEQ